MSKQKRQPETTFAELPIGARFSVSWTGETFVKIDESRCAIMVMRNLATSPEPFGATIRVRRVGKAYWPPMVGALRK